jgi:CSLREA domain-containing protein
LTRFEQGFSVERGSGLGRGKRGRTVTSGSKRFRMDAHLKVPRLIAVVGLAAAALTPTASAYTRTPARAQATTFTVSTTVDAPHAAPLDGTCTSTATGACTLRAAIQAADFLGDGPHTINLAAPGTYKLTVAGPDEDRAATGDLDVNGTSVVVANTSKAPVTIDGNLTDRAFSIGRVAPAQFTISGMTIQNGSVPGASIPINSGGALDVAAGSTANVSDMVFTGNRAAFAGGAIRNEGTTNLSSSVLSGNASVIADGGFANNEGSTARLTNVVISANAANINGGFANRGLATLTNVLIAGNLAFGLAGAMANANGANLTMTNVTISANTSFFLIGGFGNLGTATLTNVTITGNSAQGDLGGMGNLGTATLTNVTITDNSGPGGTGGLASGPEARAILEPLAAILAISGVVIPQPGPTVVRRSIIANNTPGGQCSGPITSEGGNLEFAGHTCGFKPELGDLVNVEPLLGPLAPNGGFVPTQALLPGSPAIDAIKSGCPPPGFDARGVPRAQGKGCDIGAYERSGKKLVARLGAISVAPGRLIVAIQASRPAVARLTLARTGRRVAGMRSTLQAGFNALPLPLPRTLGPGAYRLSVVVLDHGRVVSVFTRTVRLR